MIFIAHRGNITGKNLRENTPDYIEEALHNNYDVEIDVWKIDSDFFLGHDNPNTKIDASFLSKKGLWIHAKNIEALHALHDKTNCFFHNTDEAVLTSHNLIWVYPGKTLLPGSIAVLPETVQYSFSALKQCYAICSDIIGYWKNIP
jgi:hypothetical protein